MKFSTVVPLDKIEMKSFEKCEKMAATGSLKVILQEQPKLRSKKDNSTLKECQPLSFAKMLRKSLGGELGTYIGDI